jgi:hypothetical protein
MRRIALLGAAVLAASLSGAGLAADKAVDMKAAQKEYNAAVAKAKSDFDKAIAACKKGAEDKRSACYKEARLARRASRDAASDAYTNATGKPEPSPGA